MNKIEELLKSQFPQESFNDVYEVFNIQKMLDENEKYQFFKQFIEFDLKSSSFENFFETEEQKITQQAQQFAAIKVLNEGLKAKSRVITITKETPEENEYNDIKFLDDLRDFLQLPDDEKKAMIKDDCGIVQLGNYQIMIKSLDDRFIEKDMNSFINQLPQNIVSSEILPLLNCQDLFKLRQLNKEWQNKIKYFWFQQYQKEKQQLQMLESNEQLNNLIHPLFLKWQLYIRATLEKIKQYLEQIDETQLTVAEKMMLAILFLYIKINPLNMKKIGDYTYNVWDSISPQANTLYHQLTTALDDNFQFMSIAELNKIKSNFLQDNTLSIHEFEQNDNLKNQLLLAFLIQAFYNYGVLKNCLDIVHKQREWIEKELFIVGSDPKEHQNFLDEANEVIDDYSIYPEFPVEFFNEMQKILIESIKNMDFSQFTQDPNPCSFDIQSIIDDPENQKEMLKKFKIIDNEEEQKQQQIEEKKQNQQIEEQKAPFLQEEEDEDYKNYSLEVRTIANEIKSINKKLPFMQALFSLLLTLQQQCDGDKVDYSKKAPYINQKDGQETQIYMDLHSQFDIFLNVTVWHLNELKQKLEKGIKK